MTAGVLEGPPSPALTPLIEAATLTLAACGTGKQTGPSGPPESAHSGACPLPREVIPVGDLGCGLDEAVARLEAAVARSPRAAVACGQLVRQTAALAPQPGAGTTAALAAEAAAYSLLLGGPEFARWLAERGASRRREPPPEPVHLTREGAGLLIVLDDPGRRNAFSARMREALFDAMVLAEADDTIGSVTLRGTGPAFCAGGDLDEFGTAEDLVAAYLVRLARLRGGNWTGSPRRSPSTPTGRASAPARRSPPTPAGSSQRRMPSSHFPRSRWAWFPGRRLRERTAPDRPLARGVADAHRGPAACPGRAAVGTRR